MWKTKSKTLLSQQVQIYNLNLIFNIPVTADYRSLMQKMLEELKERQARLRPGD